MGGEESGVLVWLKSDALKMTKGENGDELPF